MTFGGRSHKISSIAPVSLRAIDIRTLAVLKRRELYVIRRVDSIWRRALIVIVRLSRGSSTAVATNGRIRGRTLACEFWVWRALSLKKQILLKVCVRFR